MEKGMLIFVVILMFFAGMGLVAYSLISTTLIVNKLSNTTEHMDNMNAAQHDSHYIRSVYFYEDPLNKSDICGSITKKQTVIIKVILNTKIKRDYCILKVDGRFEKQVVPYYPPCTTSCDDEIELIIDIDKKDIYSEHVFEFCCDEICAEKTLGPLCTY